MTLNRDACVNSSASQAGPMHGKGVPVPDPLALQRSSTHVVGRAIAHDVPFCAVIQLSWTDVAAWEKSPLQGRRQQHA